MISFHLAILGLMISLSIELEIKDTTYTDISATYLDLHLGIDSEWRLGTQVCVKRDDSKFPIVNFQFICSNIPATPAYGVYIYQLIKYVRACAFIRNSLKESWCKHGSYWTNGYCWVRWSQHFERSMVATMTWLAGMEYMCHKWTCICSIRRKHFPVLSSCITCHRVCNYINTMGATGGAGTAYPSGVPMFTLSFSRCRVTRALVSCVCLADRCLSFYPYTILSFFDGFWSPSWYLQTLLINRDGQEFPFTGLTLLHVCISPTTGTTGF